MSAHLILNPDPARGLDALLDELTPEWLEQRLPNSRLKAKALIMDQKVIADIGNAYVDAILWDAWIHPGSISRKIPPDRLKALAKSIDKVLIHAEKAIFKAHPDIIAGEFRNFLSVHQAKKGKSTG